MFAHQVIDDFKKVIPIMESREMVAEILVYIELIKKSIKFSIGNLDAVYDLKRPWIGKNLVFDPVYSKLPYPIMWLDWVELHEEPLRSDQRRVRKCGAILMDMDKTMLPTVFNGKIDTRKRLSEPSDAGEKFIAIFFFWCVEDPEAFSRVGCASLWTPALMQISVDLNADSPNQIQLIRGLSLRKELAKNYPTPEREHQLLKMLLEEGSNDIFIVYAAIKLLHCKNIVKRIVKAPEKLNKKRLKAEKQPIYSYHVLDVEVPGARYEKDASSKDRGKHRTMPLHMCRGHFKEFSKDKPLFGKVHGLYWWQPHVRGTIASGVVDKDYRMVTA